MKTELQLSIQVARRKRRRPRPRRRPGVLSMLSGGGKHAGHRPWRVELKLADLWTDRGRMTVLADGCCIAGYGGFQARRHSCCRCVARVILRRTKTFRRLVLVVPDAMLVGRPAGLEEVRCVGTGKRELFCVATV